MQTYPDEGTHQAAKFTKSTDVDDAEENSFVLEQKMAKEPGPASSDQEAKTEFFKPTSYPTIVAGRKYRPQAEELRAIAAVQTLATWRHLGKGPPYVLCGSNVIYDGADLLAWLNAQRITPAGEAS